MRQYAYSAAKYQLFFSLKYFFIGILTLYQEIK